MKSVSRYVQKQFFLRLSALVGFAMGSPSSLKKPPFSQSSNLAGMVADAAEEIKDSFAIPQW